MQPTARVQPTAGHMRHRSAALWEHAQHGATLVMDQALNKFPGDIQVIKPFILVSEEDVTERARSCVQKIVGVGGRAYVGSTSDPAWRWEGGWYLTSESRRTGHGGDGSWRYMKGHKHSWRCMLVLGSWPDAETGNMETACIRKCRMVAPRRLTNKATDARRLEIREHPGYSFVYTSALPRGSAAIAKIRHPSAGPSQEPTQVATVAQIAAPQRTARRR